MAGIIRSRHLLRPLSAILGLALIISASNPGLFAPVLDPSPSSDRAASRFSNWVNLNSTTHIEVGLRVRGDVTLYQYPNVIGTFTILPILYVLSPDQFSEWARSGSTPSSYVLKQDKIVYDSGSQTIWLRFNFTSRLAAFYYFVVSTASGYATPTNAKLNAVVERPFVVSWIWWVWLAGTLLLGIETVRRLVSEASRSSEGNVAAPTSSTT